MAKLSLEMDGIITTFEIEDKEEGLTFDELLSGFLGCMFGQGYIPGTEMHCFREYINRMKPLYTKSEHNN